MGDSSGDELLNGCGVSALEGDDPGPGVTVAVPVVCLVLINCAVMAICLVAYRRRLQGTRKESPTKTPARAVHAKEAAILSRNSAKTGALTGDDPYVNALSNESSPYETIPDVDKDPNQSAYQELGPNNRGGTYSALEPSANQELDQPQYDVTDQYENANL